MGIAELIRIIDHEAISVVHCHNPNGGYWGVLQPYSVKKAICGLHSTWISLFQGAPVKTGCFIIRQKKFWQSFQILSLP